MTHTFPATLVAGRRAVLEAGTTLDGAAFVRALSDATDRGLRDLVAAVCGHDTSGLAVVATGGYGRRELAPASDLDVLLLHDGSRRDIDQLASALWYPLWDAGLRLGHAVRTIDEQARLAKEDLQTATACLSIRHLAGTAELSEQLAALALAAWRRRPQRSLEALAAHDAERHARAGDVAYLLEPDLKDGVGGLRDVHSLRWASAAGLELLGADADAIERASAGLLAVRVALQLSAGRPGDVLRLESQDAVAERVGASADVLMAEVAASGRTIAWVYEQTWSSARRRQRGRLRGDEAVVPGVVVRSGGVELDETADPAAHPALVFEVAIAAASRALPVGRTSLNRLAAELPDFAERFPDGWPQGALDRFVALLLVGHEAIPVLESLDQVGLLTRVLPEWAAVRSKPQRNAYHRFTVDRHLWEATANAARLVDRVERPDLLVLAAMFHDLGKGFAGDHTDQGVRLIGRIGPRLGLAPGDVDVVANLIRHHLLLPDVAVRRDLADPATTANVAAAVRSTAELDLLHALTIADSLATGPTAWSDWKAGLVTELVERTRVELGGGGSFDPEFRLFPDGEAQAAMAEGRQQVRIDGDSVTTVTADVPGSFARVAGALSLHRLDVVSAMADSQSTASGAMAAARFRFLTPRERPVTAFADELQATIERALAGELAIEARLAERARSASRRRRLQATGPGEPSVTFLDDASDVATVIEVRAPTVPGLLHRLAKAIADVGLDIRHATVQTVGLEAVDTFYVLTQRGDVVTDAFHRAEIRRALLHAVSP